MYTSLIKKGQTLKEYVKTLLQKAICLLKLKLLQGKY